ncbi:unnamed protein product [Discosporangium mesarthrocarpum]
MWDVPDFVGKYHLNKMTVDFPVPGTTIRIEREREVFREDRARSQREALEEIDARRILRTRGKSRQAAVTARVKVQTTVGFRIDAGQRMYNIATVKKRQRLLRKSIGEPDAEFLQFLRHVETNNIYQVKAKLRDEKFVHINTAEDRHSITALHRAVNLGLVDMTRILLEAGADPDPVSLMGDAPIHSCWSFWKGDEKKYFLWCKSPFHMVTPQDFEDFARMEKDVKKTVELLRLIIRHGADVDARRNNGEVALHTAARRGPVQALWVLLLSKATHDIKDHRGLTSQQAAARANQKGHVVMLANWSTTRMEYKHSEFREEWMHFLVDPDTNLGGAITAGEVLAQVNTEQHEQSTAVRSGGGYTFIDEVITGPIKPPGGADTAGPSLGSASLTSPRRGSEELNPTQSHSGAEQQVQAGMERQATGRPREMPGQPSPENTQPKGKSKLGKELDVYISEARDSNMGQLVGSVDGEASAFARHMALSNLEGRKNRRGNSGSNRVSNKSGNKAGQGQPGDEPLGRLTAMTQRRLMAAREVSEDGEVEGPLLRPATSSALLTTRTRMPVKVEAPHHYYGRRLLTRRRLNEREREAKFKPTATISVNQGLTGDMCAEGGSAGGWDGQRSAYLNDIRMASNDTKLLPGPKDARMRLEGRGQLHASHPLMRLRKQFERPFCELQGSRKHDENVSCSILENYRPSGWIKTSTFEPLLLKKSPFPW